MASTQTHAPPVLGIRSPSAFEFPKRKRWADLLLTELVDDIAFVLSPTYKIMYCGPAITELLGWKDTGLSDMDFVDLVTSVDQDRFRIAFRQALQNRAEFDIAVGLRSATTGAQYTDIATSGDVLFDIKLYPHIISEHEESKCIFAVASPYASRNTQMLNTILDLRADNERLQQRVAEYRARLPAEKSTSNATPPSQPTSMYATSSLHSTRPTTLSVSASHKLSDLSGTMSDPFKAASSSSMDVLDYSKTTLYNSTAPHTEDQSEEGSKKKKMKRAQTTEQYVCITCGRTDSPEWRKGPLGPKTLCNACGLRWAKQMRKAEEPADDSINVSGVDAIPT